MMVLLLDDDDAFRSALGEMLGDDGHTVCAYRSIAELPPLAELPALAAMITDYQLGDGEDGLRIAQRFNAVHPSVPVIIVTSYPTEHLQRSVADATYLSLLRKPVRYEELHRLLHRDT